MERKKFIKQSLLAGTLWPVFINAKTFASSLNPKPKDGPSKNIFPSQEGVYVERPQSGKPHKGKVLAAIQPHCDDIPIFAGGTVAKLIKDVYFTPSIASPNLPSNL